MATKAVSGPMMYVPRQRSISRRISPASKRWRSSSGVMLTRAVARWHTRPVMWNSGAIATVTSPVPSDHQRVITSALWTIASWVLIAPFGTPVVPEV